jgi:hypothetical protein
LLGVVNKASLQEVRDMAGQEHMWWANVEWPARHANSI